MIVYVKLFLPLFFCSALGPDFREISTWFTWISGHTLRSQSSTAPNRMLKDSIRHYILTPDTLTNSFVQLIYVWSPAQVWKAVPLLRAAPALLWLHPKHGGTFVASSALPCSVLTNSKDSPLSLRITFPWLLWKCICFATSSPPLPPNTLLSIPHLSPSLFAPIICDVLVRKKVLPLVEHAQLCKTSFVKRSARTHHLSAFAASSCTFHLSVQLVSAGWEQTNHLIPGSSLPWSASRLGLFDRFYIARRPHTHTNQRLIWATISTHYYGRTFVGQKMLPFQIARSTSSIVLDVESSFFKVDTQKRCPF